MNKFRKRRVSRPGVTLAESAIVLGVCLVLILGILDLGVAVVQYNSLSEGARQLARAAIVHGALCTPELNAWGPTAYEGTAGDSSEMAAALSPALATMNPQSVAFTVNWLDGDNQIEDRVKVTVTYQHKPIVPLVNYGAAINLSASSTMYIAH